MRSDERNKTLYGPYCCSHAEISIFSFHMELSNSANIYIKDCSLINYLCLISLSFFIFMSPRRRSWWNGGAGLYRSHFITGHSHILWSQGHCRRWYLIFTLLSIPQVYEYHNYVIMSRNIYKVDHCIKWASILFLLFLISKAAISCSLTNI